MVKIVVIDREGAEHEIGADAGQNVMESIRDADIEGVEALCGGSCSCATCHVHVSPEWLDATGSASADEVELLEYASNRRPESRLSCQIEITPELEGLRVTVPQED